MQTEPVDHVGSANRMPFLKFGNAVRTEMFDQQGASIFGAIDQQVAHYQGRQQ